MQAERLEMQQRQLAKEEAAATEANRKAMLQKQYAEEDVAAARSYESEVDGPTGRVETQQKQPKPNPSQSRRVEERDYVKETRESKK